MQCIQQSFSCSSMGTMGFQGHSSVPFSVACLTEFTATGFQRVRFPEEKEGAKRALEMWPGRGLL